jgi:hypothetical protein
MRGRQVTVKLYRAECSLSDAEIHSFRIKEIRVRAISLMSVPLHNPISVRIIGYEIKNEVGKLRDFSLKLIQNIVCVLLENFRPSRILKVKFCTKWKSKKFTDFKKKSRILSDLIP